jgi:alpha-glucosidase
MERRVWKFVQYTPYMSDALRLRSALLPFTYSSAAEAALGTSVATMHPLYLDWPSEPSAYTAGEELAQYMFGALLASPVWETNASTLVGGVEGGWKSTWLPPLQHQQRQWCSWNATECLEGNATVARFYPLWDTPLWVPSGSIIPMQTLASVGRPAPDPLVVTVFPFAPAQAGEAHFSLYEDAGEGGEFRQGEFWRVPLTATTAAGSSSSSLTVGAAVGAWAGAPAERGLEMRWRGMAATGKVVRSVTVNGGAPLPAGAQGCGGGCYFIVGPVEHSLLAPEGTLVVVAPGKFSVRANTTIQVLLG